MRMSISGGEGAADVAVFVSEAEAERIAQAIRSHLNGEPGYRGPGYHLHLEAEDGSELTIGIHDSE